jgi:putative methylase
MPGPSPAPTVPRAVPPRRRSDLIRALSGIPDFPTPDPRFEQVVTPPEAAAELLLEAVARGDLVGRSVVDLGTGTGRLAIGASLLGATPVLGIDVAGSALEIARRSAMDLGAHVEFRASRVGVGEVPEGTVVMNPPFGAQHRGADRPFWRVALRPGARAVYAFALSDSRTFIEGRAVERLARIETIRRVPWSLPATFAHHRRRAVELSVDLWVVRTGADEP